MGMRISAPGEIDHNERNENRVLEIYFFAKFILKNKSYLLIAFKAQPLKEKPGLFLIFNYLAKAFFNACQEIIVGDYYFQFKQLCHHCQAKYNK